MRERAVTEFYGANGITRRNGETETKGGVRRRYAARVEPIVSVFPLFLRFSVCESVASVPSVCSRRRFYLTITVPMFRRFNMSLNVATSLLTTALRSLVAAAT